VATRAGFQKVYDLAERVLPRDVDTTTPSLPEYARHLIRRQLTANGYATLGTCTYQLRTPGLRTAVQHELGEACLRSDLIRVRVACADGTDEIVHVEPDALEQRPPPAPARARILSPFDNVVIQRERAARLFGFDYRIECYVPEHKRQFGYFCLPLLYRDRFVGRVDCKAHRRERRLELRRLFIEHADRLLPDADRGIAALARALAEFSAAQACDRIEVLDVLPAMWREPLIAALHELEQCHP
jgi:uncharacterized protein